MFGNKHFTYLGRADSESKRCYNKIFSVHYFYAKTNMLADFQICVSVPLKLCDIKSTEKSLQSVIWSFSKKWSL